MISIPYPSRLCAIGIRGWTRTRLLPVASSFDSLREVAAHASLGNSVLLHNSLTGFELDHADCPSHGGTISLHANFGFALLAGACWAAIPAVHVRRLVAAAC